MGFQGRLRRVFGRPTYNFKERYMEESVLEFLKNAAPWVEYVLMGLGSAIVVAEVVVLLTPSSSDNEAWAKIKAIPVLGSFISAITKFSVIASKPKDKQ